MEHLRELSLNKGLEELIQEQLATLQDKKVRVVFYKEEGGWQTNTILLQEDNTVSKRNLKTLKWIRSVDNKAIVIEEHDFKKDWEDELITLEEMVGTIEYRYNQMDCHNNISKFLEKYAEEQNNIEIMKKAFKQWTEENSNNELQKSQEKQATTLKFDKKEFLQSKLGSMLYRHINKLGSAISKHEYEDEYKNEPEYNVFEEIKIINAILTAIKQCYGVTYYIVFNHDKNGIFSPDTNDWLFEY